MKDPQWVLALNCGSSSIKFALFDATKAPLPETPAWRGHVSDIGTHTASMHDSERGITALPSPENYGFGAALRAVHLRVLEWLHGQPLLLVAHRVVHGGARFVEPVRVDAAVLAKLQSYAPLAPLHHPPALEAIEQWMETSPQVPQVACFDTSFHRTLPEVETMLPLPPLWPDVRRYGFHGLSYQFVAHRLRQTVGVDACERVIVAHLGNGASLCAMRKLQSLATTMGFSALDGLMMGTRPGAIDPGVLLHLLQREGYTPDALAELLYQQSGLLGVSGQSSDLRQLLAPGAGIRAHDAVALYVHRIVREIGALMAVLGGLDLLVFTGGVGEHSAALRARIAAALGYLGLRLDTAANADDHTTISCAWSHVRVLVVPTNEEWVLASQAVATFAPEREGAARLA